MYVCVCVCEGSEKKLCADGFIVRDNVKRKQNIYRLPPRLEHYYSDYSKLIITIATEIQLIFFANLFI